MFLQVKDLLAKERSSSSSLELRLNRVNSSLSGLMEVDVELKEKTNLLNSSFTSLLEDTVRHDEVLELLLHEEVLEFLEWPAQDQEALSIPALKEQLRLLQERRERSSRSGGMSPSVKTQTHTDTRTLTHTESYTHTHTDRHTDTH